MFPEYLRPGAKGSAVLLLKLLFMAMGIRCSFVVNDEYDDQLLHIIKGFQALVGISQDGSFGPVTKTEFQHVTRINLDDIELGPLTLTKLLKLLFLAGRTNPNIVVNDEHDCQLSYAIQGFQEANGISEDGFGPRTRCVFFQDTGINLDKIDLSSFGVETKEAEALFILPSPRRGHVMKVPRLILIGMSNSMCR